MKHDVAVLQKLLNKESGEILEDALECYIERGLSHDVRTVYKQVLEISAKHRPAQSLNGPRSGTLFEVTAEGRKRQFNPAKTRGRIIHDLTARGKFSREDFRQAVASIMGWNPTSGKFGIKTKFQSLDHADRAWWGTLKGRDKLISESTT